MSCNSFIYSLKKFKLTERIAQKYREINNDGDNENKIVHSASLNNSFSAGSGSTINNISTTHHTSNTTVQVQPDIEQVSDEKVSTLQTPVDQIVQYEKCIKRNQEITANLIHLIVILMVVLLQMY